MDFEYKDDDEEREEDRGEELIDGDDEDENDEEDKKGEEGLENEEIQIKNASKNLNELGMAILDDSDFGQTIIRTKDKSRSINVLLYFEDWLQIVREDLLKKHYPNFDLNNYKMIVVGSSGVDGYNSLRALVADDEFAGIPDAVKNFIHYLNIAVSLDRGPITMHNQNYDFRCTQSMHQVLFINVCHSRSPEDQEWANAACSIKFVNKILEKKFIDKKSIAILDVRMSMHTHEDDAKPDSIVQDSRKEYLQNEECFKIVNPNDYHRYVRLGNPGFRHYDPSDETYCVEQLRQLHKDGFPIAKLFEPKEDSKRKHGLDRHDMFSTHSRPKTMRKNPKHSDKDTI